MRTRKNASQKLTVVLLSIILVLCCTIGGTLAWLSAESGPVTNTFTVGDINITLQEYPFKINEDGSVSTSKLDEAATPVQEINTYKVVPGGTQPKKPFVTVKEKSENCYVYVCIENNLTIDNEVVVTYDINLDKWERVATKTDATTGAVTTLYRYKTIVPYAEADSDPIVVFENVSYANSIKKDTTEKESIGQLEGKTIVLNAFAHQSEYTDVNTANAEAIAHFKLS